MTNIDLKIEEFKKSHIEHYNTKECLYELIDQIIDNMTIINKKFNQSISDIDHSLNKSVELNEIKLFTIDYGIFVKSYKAKLITDIQKTSDQVKYKTNIVISNNFSGNIRPIQVTYVPDDLVVATELKTIESILNNLDKDITIQVVILKNLLKLFD